MGAQAAGRPRRSRPARVRRARCSWPETDSSSAEAGRARPAARARGAGCRRGRPARASASTGVGRSLRGCRISSYSTDADQEGSHHVLADQGTAASRRRRTCRTAWRLVWATWVGACRHRGSGCSAKRAKERDARLAKPELQLESPLCPYTHVLEHKHRLLRPVKILDSPRVAHQLADERAELLCDLAVAAWLGRGDLDGRDAVFLAQRATAEQVRELDVAVVQGNGGIGQSAHIPSGAMWGRIARQRDGGHTCALRRGRARSPRRREQGR